MLFEVVTRGGKLGLSLMVTRSELKRRGESVSAPSFTFKVTWSVLKVRGFKRRTLLSSALLNDCKQWKRQYYITYSFTD